MSMPLKAGFSGLQAARAKGSSTVNPRCRLRRPRRSLNKLVKNPGVVLTDSLRLETALADARTLTDSGLVELREAKGPAPRALIDECYRRCIPLYVDFLGVHWHTGFYLRDAEPSPADQVRMIDHVARSVGLGRHERVLDIGCGIGGTVCHLNRHYGCEAVGLTPIPEQKAMAERLARSLGAVIQVDLGHADALPYPSASFDVVTTFESTCHFEDRGAFFHEVFRILKPGERLAGEEWLAHDLCDEDQRTRWIEPSLHGQKADLTSRPPCAVAPINRSRELRWSIGAARRSRISRHGRRS